MWSKGLLPLRHHLLVSLGQRSFCVYMAHPAILALSAPWLQSEEFGSAAAASVVVVLVVALATCQARRNTV